MGNDIELRVVKEARSGRTHLGRAIESTGLLATSWETVVSFDELGPGAIGRSYMTCLINSLMSASPCAFSD